jgi:putative transposase
MPDYRRTIIPGTCYFFTLVTYQRKPLFTNPRNRLLLRQAMEQVIQKYPFTINALVLLPDHLHCVMTLPEADTDYSKRWSMIKCKFSQAVAINNETACGDSG